MQSDYKALAEYYRNELDKESRGNIWRTVTTWILTLLYFASGVACGYGLFAK
jgi:hypothetical protein